MEDKPIIEKRPRGRPRIEIDYELIRSLAEIQCTQVEISHIIGVSDKTLSANPHFQEVYKQGVAQGNKSLKRKQFERAMAGSDTMLIWLGKQRLGQVDRVDTAISGNAIGIIWADEYGEKANKADSKAITNQSSSDNVVQMPSAMTQ